MNAMEEMVTESIRIVRTQERIGALLHPINMMDTMLVEILEDAPELHPELDAVRERLADTCSHISAALSVVQAKIDLL